MTNSWADYEDGQLTLGAYAATPSPPALKLTQPEDMSLEQVLESLYDSMTPGKVEPPIVVRLLARYKTLTGKQRPEFLNGH